MIHLPRFRLSLSHPLRQTLVKFAVQPSDKFGRIDFDGLFWYDEVAASGSAKAIQKIKELAN
jgi:hypothetical protein